MNDETLVEKEVKTEMTAGEMLRNARTTGRRKREIQTIAKLLCIREEFLQALEDGNYNAIPELVYVLGFARNYAMELGLDADEIVAKIKREMGVVSDAEPVVVAEKEHSQKDIKKFSFNDAMRFDWLKKAYGFVWRNWIWFLGAFVLILAVLGAIVLLSRKPQQPVTVQDVAPAVAQVVSEPKYRKPVRERFETKNRDTANVIIQATAESWVKIEDARGSTVFSRVLVSGDVLYIPKGDKYKGTFGNAGGIDVWVDGALAPAIGANHTRKNSVSLAPDSLMKAKDEKSEKSDKADEKKAKNPASEYGTLE